MTTHTKTRTQALALLRQCAQLHARIDGIERRCDEALGIRQPRRKPQGVHAAVMPAANQPH